jgi:tetratricopeptide (TPR) repeat protein
VAGSLSTLAAAYFSFRQTAQAEQLLVRALAIREKALGPNHPDVARNQVSLATIYCSQHRYAEAQELLQQATSNLEKSLTADNPEARACLQQYTAVLRKTHQSGGTRTANGMAKTLR